MQGEALKHGNKRRWLSIERELARLASASQARAVFLTFLGKAKLQ